jgi:hypothetical protein
MFTFGEGRGGFHIFLVRGHLVHSPIRHSGSQHSRQLTIPNGALASASLIHKNARMLVVALFVKYSREDWLERIAHFM